MKKLLLLLAFLITITARAATTVSGTLLTPSEAAVTTNAYVRLELSNYGTNLPRVLGTNTILPSYIDIYPDSNGLITTTLTGNELISPGNTWYNAKYFRNGKRFYECNFYVTSLLTGTVNTSGTAVTYVSGTQFPFYTDVRGATYSFDWVGSIISINSVNYVIATVNSATSITLATSAGVQSGVAYSHGANTQNLDTVNCIGAVPPSAIPSETCAQCIINNPVDDDLLNLTINRWASLVYSCGTGAGPIDKADGVFVEWDDSAIADRACPGDSYAAGYSFPLARFTTTTAASNYHTITTYGANDWALNVNPQFSIRTSFANRVSGFRRWIAWTSASILNMVAINDPVTSQVAGFYACSDAGATCEGAGAPDTGASNVYCYVANGTNSTHQDSGTDFVNDQVYLYQVFYDTSTSTATFKIDGTTVCTMTTNAPLNTENVSFHSSITNVSGSVDYTMLVYAIFIKNALSF